MSEGADLGRIVSLIMENPKLIEEISNLGRNSPPPEGEGEEITSESAEIKTSAQASARDAGGERNRSVLLSALKPYVSRDRAAAIDSMISIVEILDKMKGR